MIAAHCPKGKDLLTLFFFFFFFSGGCFYIPCTPRRRHDSQAHISHTNPSVPVLSLIFCRDFSSFSWALSSPTLPGPSDESRGGGVRTFPRRNHPPPLSLSLARRKEKREKRGGRRLREELYTTQQCCLWVLHSRVDDRESKLAIPPPRPPTTVGRERQRESSTDQTQIRVGASSQAR